MKNESNNNQETKAMPYDAMLATALTSPALKWQSDKKGKAAYPANFRGRVPLKVKVTKTVRPVMPGLAPIFGIKKGTFCLKDHIYVVWVNSYGAVSAILENGEQLGLLPSEFDVIEWHS